jgi:preprotein translocase subunit SecB
LPIKPDDYLDFLRRIKLKGVGLDSSTTSVDRSRLAEALSKKADLSVNLKVELNVIQHEIEDFVVAGIFEVVQHLASDDIPIVTIASNFSALFGLLEKTEKHFLDRFSQGEARLVFWPYLRHFVSDMCYRMSVPQILIPLTSEFNENGEESSKQPSKIKK